MLCMYFLCFVNQRSKIITKSFSLYINKILTKHDELIAAVQLVFWYWIQLKEFLFILFIFNSTWLLRRWCAWWWWWLWWWKRQGSRWQEQGSVSLAWSGEVHRIQKKSRNKSLNSFHPETGWGTIYWALRQVWQRSDPACYKYGTLGWQATSPFARELVGQCASLWGVECACNWRCLLFDGLNLTIIQLLLIMVTSFSYE